MVQAMNDFRYPTIEELQAQAAKLYRTLLSEQEIANASNQTPHQESEKGGNASNDARISSGLAAVGVEERPQGDIPPTGDSNRVIGIGTEQALTEAGQKAWVEQRQREEEEARKRQALTPHLVRIILKDGLSVDCGITIPWLNWVQQMLQWHGVVLDYGYIPMDLIKVIMPINPDGTPAAWTDNVVPFKKP